MDGAAGFGSWVMFVDSGGHVVEGKVISDPESPFGGPAVVWVDVAQPDGSTEATPVPANEVRRVERL